MPIQISAMNSYPGSSGHALNQPVPQFHRTRLSRQRGRTIDIKVSAASTKDVEITFADDAAAY